MEADPGHQPPDFVDQFVGYCNFAYTGQYAGCVHFTVHQPDETTQTFAVQCDPENGAAAVIESPDQSTASVCVTLDKEVFEQVFTTGMGTSALLSYASSGKIKVNVFSIRELYKFGDSFDWHRWDEFYEWQDEQLQEQARQRQAAEMLAAEAERRIQEQAAVEVAVEEAEQQMIEESKPTDVHATESPSEDAEVVDEVGAAEDVIGRAVGVIMDMRQKGLKLEGKMGSRDLEQPPRDQTVQNEQQDETDEPLLRTTVQKIMEVREKGLEQEYQIKKILEDAVAEEVQRLKQQQEAVEEARKVRMHKAEQGETEEENDDLFGRTVVAIHAARKIEAKTKAAVKNVLLTKRKGSLDDDDEDEEDDEPPAPGSGGFSGGWAPPRDHAQECPNDSPFNSIRSTLLPLVWSSRAAALQQIQWCLPGASCASHKHFTSSIVRTLARTQSFLGLDRMVSFMLPSAGDTAGHQRGCKFRVQIGGNHGVLKRLARTCLLYTSPSPRDS
eukprot:TRINITY_DN5155_c0_g1_i2.p1 TRINITY_DN5155_c0_g1~~TRINITY_DN5155_c0_g1_i2.p1  ORF type:complete len:499 (-),score=130.40 TRINITY_DN5155_c0_g1_i2:174-1670(-)